MMRATSKKKTKKQQKKTKKKKKKGPFKNPETIDSHDRRKRKEFSTLMLFGKDDRVSMRKQPVL